MRLILLTFLLIGCASEPTKVRVRNCKEMSEKVFICEEIPERRIPEHNRPL